MDELNYVDAAAIKAMKSYLRVCSSGGMPQEHIDTVISSVECAADLNYFALAFAQALKDRGYKIVVADPLEADEPENLGFEMPDFLELLDRPFK